MSQQLLTDVTAWQTLWSPADGQAIHDAVLAQIEDGTAKGATLLSSQYGFTDADIAQAMGAAGAANAANRYLFDSSQFADSRERPLVLALVKQLQPDQWGVGTSSDDREILHAKILALLYPDGTGWTFSGSFNLSESAEKEFNVADLIWSRTRANAFAVQIQTALSWVQANETQP